jgi:outer membrane protein
MRVKTARRRSLEAMLLLVLLALPAALSAQAVPDRLTLEEAISLARENNPSYLTQANQIGAAEWGVRSAYASLLPTLSTSTGLGYVATGERRFDSVVLEQQPAQLSSRYSIGLNLTLNGSTLLAPSVARAQARATEETVDGAASTLDADVTQRYVTVLESLATIDQAERELERTAEHVRLAQARLDVGAGTSLDVRRAEVQNGQAEVRLLQAQNTAANNLLLLSQTIGVRLPEDVELEDAFQLFEPRWTAEELVPLAIEENPTLRASRAQASAAATRARAATSAYLPTVSFNAGLSGYVSSAESISPIVSQQMRGIEEAFQGCLRENEVYTRVGLPPRECLDPGVPGFEEALRSEIDAANKGFPFDWIRQPASASVTVSLPIFTGLTRQLQVEEARIARINAQYQVQAQQLQVEVEVESALRNVETAYQSALLQQQIRATAEEELRLAEERFRFGATTSVEVVDAQASLAEAERAEIAARYEFHRSLAILEARIGQRLER